MDSNYRKAKKVYGFYKTKAQRAAQYFSNVYDNWRNERKNIRIEQRNQKKMNNIK